MKRILSLAAGLLLSALNPTMATDVLPNVVFILADDLGYGDLSCQGVTHVRAPHIDSLAKQGRKFTDAHSASAVCTPSRPLSIPTPLSK